MIHWHNPDLEWLDFHEPLPDYDPYWARVLVALLAVCWTALALVWVLA